MEKIGNLDDIKKGGSFYFDYKGEKAILIRTRDDDLVAYIAVCPHEGGNIEWDGTINMILCECHLSLFLPENGSVYRHSSVFELNEGLKKLDVTVDEGKNILVT